ncbi:MAG: glycerophosphodiester phosphodiesterase family protein [Gemmatimonadota bacterium]
MGHRGAAGVAPENTVEAIRHAVAGGAQAIEVDVHVTTCGTPVTIHDHTLDRTTESTGTVESRDLVALRAFDAGFRFTADRGRSFPFRGTGVRIPTLDEAAEAAAELPMIIEVKTRGAGRALADWLASRDDPERFLVGGFERAVVAPAAEAARWRCAAREDLKPFILLGKLGLPARVSPSITAFMVPVRQRALRIVTRRFVRQAHEHGVGVYVWTVNRPAEMRTLLDLGVDGLISDVPGRIRRIIAERSAYGIQPGAVASSGFLA